MLTVGAIVKEPPATLRRFIEWHVRRGADRIALCFDDPKDPAIDLAREWAEVEAIPCDAAFWEGIGVDPEARFTPACQAPGHGPSESFMAISRPRL